MKTSTWYFVDGSRWRKWVASAICVALVVSGALAVDTALAPAAQAATVPLTGGVGAQMQNHIGYTSENGMANPTTNDGYRYGSALNGVASGSISNPSGSNGTTGQQFSNGYTNTNFVASGNSAWTAHGNIGGTSLNLSDQSALGFAPSAVTSVETGQLFNIGRMAHLNNPVSVTNSWFRGNLNIRLLAQTLTYQWQMNETPNNCSGANCADDFVNFRNQIANQTFSIDGLTYALVVQGFTAPQTGTTCSPTLTEIGTVRNVFRTVEGTTTYGCLYASLQQVRPVNIVKQVVSPYGPAPATSFPFTTTSTLAGSDWANGSFSLAGGGTRSGTYVSGGQISITETEPVAPWAFTSIECRDGVNALIPGVTVTGRQVTIPPNTTAATSAAAPITCTYTNTYTPTGTLTLIKNVVSTGQPGTVAVPADWALSAAGEGAVAGRSVSGPGNTAAVTAQTVVAGTYELSEVATNPTTTAGYLPQGAWNCGLTPVLNGRIVVTNGANITCTITNQFQTGSLAITKTVAAPDAAYTLGNTKPFSAQYACAIAGTTVAEGVVTVRPSTTNGQPGATTTISNLPAGASCVVTEVNPPTGTSTDLVNGSFVWGVPSASAASVTIGALATVSVDLTNPVTQQTGALVIRKQVQAADDSPLTAYTGGSQRFFDVGYECTIGSTVTASGSVEVANGGSQTVTGIPATSACELSEALPSELTGDFIDASYAWSAVQLPDATSVPVNGQADLRVVNLFERELAELTIAKRVDGAGYDGGAFSIDYACGQGLSAVEGAVTLDGGESETVAVPAGVLCRVAENTGALPAPAAGYVWQDPSYEGLVNGGITPTLAGSTVVTVVNSAAIGFNRIEVAKRIANYAAAVLPGTTFEVQVSCDAPEQGESVNYSNTFTLTTDAGATRITPYLPIGTSCTIAETTPPTGSTSLTDVSYAWTAPSYEGLTDGSVVVPGSNVPALVTTVNDIVRVTGPLTISKSVINNTGETLTAGFSGTWVCTSGGTETGSGTWSVGPNGGNASLTGTADNGSAVLVGSSCAISELAPESPFPDDFSYAWGVEVPAAVGPMTASGVTANVRNTLDQVTGAFTVTKNVIGGVAGEHFANTNFTVDYVCTPLTGLSIVGELTVLAGGTSAPEDEIPVGATCTVTERGDSDLPVPVDPYRWTGDVRYEILGAVGSPLDNDGLTFTIPDSGATVAVGVVNTLEVREMTVTATKVVSVEANTEGGYINDNVARFPLTLSCFAADGSGGPVGDPQVVSNEGSATWQVPVGRTCSVTEGAIDGGLQDASFTWGAPSFSPSITVVDPAGPGDNSLTVTNRLQRVYGTIGLQKIVNDGGYAGVIPADTQYSGSWTCTYGAGTDYEETRIGTWTSLGSAAGITALLDGDVATIPLTSTCVATENPLNDDIVGDSSFRWDTPEITSIESVSATASEDVITVTNRLLRDTSDVTITKTLSGEQSGFDEAGFAGFTIGAVCALTEANLTDASAERLLASVLVQPGAGPISLITGVPEGWVCAFSEVAPGDAGLFDDSYEWESAVITADGAPITGPVEIGQGSLAVSIDNPISRVTDTITVAKDIPEALRSVVSPETVFSGDYTCVYAADTDREATYAGTWSVTGIGVATLTGDIDLPLGTLCAITETAPAGGLVDSSWVWPAAGPVITAAPAQVTANGPASFTVTNTPERVFAGFTAVKELTGPADGFIDPEFTVTGTWECTYGGATVGSGTWSAPATGGAATLTPEPSTVPATSTCTVREDTLQSDVFKNGSYTWGTPPAPVSAEVGGDVTPELVVTNRVERVLGTLSVDKIVERGPGVTGQVPGFGTQFSGEWTCTFDGETSEPQPWSVAEDAAQIVAADVLVGSECTFVETVMPAPVPTDASYMWTGTVIDQPAAVSTSGVIATVTNTVNRLTGSFGVTKQFEGDASGLPENPEYGFEWGCVSDSGDRFPVDGASDQFTIAAGGLWQPEAEVPEGSECTVTEVSQPTPLHDSYTWSSDFSVTGAEATDTTATSVSFEIPGASEVVPLVTATNTLTRAAGSYSVAKTSDPVSGATVMPGQRVTYTVTVTPGETGFVDDIEVRDDVSGLLAAADLDAASIEASSGSVDTSEVGRLVWSLERLDASVGAQTLTYAIVVHDDARGDQLVNVVTATGEIPPETCLPCTTVHEVPEWTLTKTSDPRSGATVRMGDVITYTLTATNSSERVALTGAQAVDDLSRVLSVAELQLPLAAELRLDGTDLIWSLPRLEPGETATVEYQVRVLSSARGETLRNVVVPGPTGICEASCDTTHVVNFPPTPVPPIPTPVAPVRPALVSTGAADTGLWWLGGATLLILLGAGTLLARRRR